MDNIVIRNSDSLAQLGGAFATVLSKVNETEFVEMITPIVHILPYELVEFVLLNITSEEAAEVVKRLEDSEVVNRIAQQTLDGIVGAECAKHKALTLVSLNDLLTKFNHVYHLSLYTVHEAADCVFLERVLGLCEQFREEHGQPLNGEEVLYRQIAAHPNADSVLLVRVSAYVENALRMLQDWKQKIKEMPKYQNRSWSNISSMELEEFEEGRQYQAVLSFMRIYLPVLLNVAEHPNLPQDKQRQLLQEFGKYYMYNLSDEPSCFVLHALSEITGKSVTAADTVAYRIFINPNSPPELKAKSTEMAGANTTIWTGNEEFKAKLQLVKDPEAIRIIWRDWAARNDSEDNSWGMNATPLTELVKAIGKNLSIPSDVMDDVVSRLLNGKIHSDLYKETWEHIAHHPNFGEVGMRFISSAIEKTSNHYLDFLCTPVLEPLCKNPSVTNEAAKSIFSRLNNSDHNYLPALIELAGNASVTALDIEFAQHEARGVRAKYAARSNDKVLLEKLMDDPERDVVVAARRRYKDLTGQKIFALDFMQNLLRIVGEDK